MVVQKVLKEGVTFFGVIFWSEEGYAEERTQDYIAPMGGCVVQTIRKTGRLRRRWETLASWLEG